MENNNDEASFKDFEYIIKKIDPDFTWPVYDDFGNVTVTGKGFVMVTSADNFHKAMEKEAKKQFGKNE